MPQLSVGVWSRGELCPCFGGIGRSATGSKAGGAHCLPRFALEQVVSVNTAAAGGNAELFSEEE